MWRLCITLGTIMMTINRKNTDIRVLKIETLCIISQIGLLMIKVSCALIEVRDDLFRYIGPRLLVIIIKTWRDFILQKRGDYL